MLEVEGLRQLLVAVPAKIRGDLIMRTRGLTRHARVARHCGTSTCIYIHLEHDEAHVKLVTYRVHLLQLE